MRGWAMLGYPAARPMTAALLGLLLSAAPAVGYLQASGWYERSSTPAHYQPLNLIDGDLRTAWCSSGGDALAETLTVGVAAPVAVDEVRVATGNQADANAFHTFARPRKFVLRTEGRASTFSVADTEGTQSVKLDTPLQGTLFALEVLDVEPADDPAMPACISEVQLVSHGKPLANPPKKLLGWNAARSALMGTWFGGDEGSPDKSLSFFVDGTWQARTVVYGEPTRPKLVSGQWGFDKKGALWMKPSGSAQVAVKPIQETKADARGKGRTTLQLSGNLPADLRVTFRDRP
jgi:hypothetical protein